ncbi:hypothetical protein KQX54_013304 [Cotesia glomerata]|uniref:Uncharacterized protein n=1 Tax=Cotesia glomerata TaxID=32391 RepID=A0AAV7IRM4_COTGL|nr:hypothetical protein KQX54_013304 [Cotesia glomerata]
MYHYLSEWSSGETADSPDEGITNDDDDPDVFHRDFNDSGKSTELVECSILNNSSKITTECNKLDNSVKLKYEADVENTETELLRKRIYQFEKDNAWLREELMKSEDSANNYKQLFYSFRQKYDRRNEEYRLLERENDEKNEIIDNMKKDQKHFQVAQEKWERERKTLIKKIETDKQNTETHRNKYDKAVNDKEKFSKQLNVYRRSLEEKEDFCNVLQKELNQLKQTLKNLEDYYEKIFSELKEQNEDLKRKNFKLELKSNDGKPSSEQLHSIPSAINLDISFDHSPDVKFNNPDSDSLYDELKASGFLPDVSYENSKIRELEEELDWQDEKARNAVDQVEYLIKYITEKKNINNNRKSNLEAKYILILLDKISQLSEVVTDAFQKRFTHDVSCQVSEDPWVDKNLQDLKILTYKNLIKPNNSSHLNIKENLLSSLSSNSVETKINPYSAVNCDNNKKKNTYNNKLLINETRIVKKPSQILTTKQHLLSNKNTEWSPIICNTPIMSEKNAPRRKISVFARTSDLDKILESQSSNENFTSSTPVPDPIPELNTYRTAQESSSDSSGNLSQLQASLEENSINDDGESTSVANNQVKFNIAPAKFNFSPTKISKQSLVPSENLATTDDDSSQFNLLGIDKKLIESSTPISNDDQYSSSDKENTSVRKELKNVTWTIESGSNSGSQKQFYNNRNKCEIYAVTEKAASESAAVTLAMSSGEDSSDSSDSDSAITCDNKDNDNNSATNIKNAQYTRDSLDANQSSHVDESFQVLSNPVKINLSNGAKKINDKTFTYKPTAKREILPVMKRSRSESENLGCGHESNLYICDVEKPKLNVNYQEFKLTVFPSLTDFRLQESGIAHLSDTDDLEEKDLVEGELERKYVAFSLGLCTDRLTLSRRKTLSQRRRDQTERNFTNEVTRMQQSIEELAPLCFDSETIDRIERARNQIEIIAQCARKVSCAAETLGAIQQEYRISRAIHLADRYLRLLRSRCEKLDRDLTESK